MGREFVVTMHLRADTPDSITFGDVHDGLANPWYRFSTQADGSVDLWATPEGFEYLARWFLKLARSEKSDGFHTHDTLEISQHAPLGEPELTIGVVKNPPRAG